MARLSPLATVSLALLALASPAGAQTSSMRPGITRQVTVGCSDTATSKDFMGTISWRSACASAKSQILPACGTYNNGAWLQIVDASGGASTNPITISAATGSVSGPTLPVKIDTDRGAFVLTCEGPAATWLVTASAAPAGAPATGGIALMIDAANCLLVSPSICFLVQ